MADKNEEIQSIEDRIALAKELYGTGCRNYLLKSYADAVEDLSRACEMYGAIYGEMADELGMPHLMYAKSLIAVAQLGENKIVDVPDEDEDENNGENGDIEDGDDEIADTNGDEEGDKKTTNGTNGTSDVQPGTSSSGGADKDSEGAEEDGEDEDDLDNDTPAANLHLAWEVLEIAVQIFSRQGNSALPNLADAYYELAEISFENSHFDVAISDYKKSEDIYMKLPDDDLRMLSSIQYKIGLCYFMSESFEESITAFKKACDIFDCRIENIKSKEEKNEKDTAALTDLEEMKQEILAKIVEIEEVTEQSREDVKKVLADIMGQPADSAIQSSSSSASGSMGESSKSKPTDISHLIKRKKPDNPTKDDELLTPPKKANI